MVGKLLVIFHIVCTCHVLHKNWKEKNIQKFISIVKELLTKDDFMIFCHCIVLQWYIYICSTHILLKFMNSIILTCFNIPIIYARYGDLIKNNDFMLIFCYQPSDRCVSLFIMTYWIKIYRWLLVFKTSKTSKRS